MNPSVSKTDPGRVADGSGAMFDSIAPRYDLVNRLISLGIDRSWRKKTSHVLALSAGARVLDLATGTADLAIQVAQDTPSAHVLGIDPSEGMLTVGRAKLARAGLEARVELQVGDAQRLDLPNASFDGVCIAFGIRNVPDRPRALAEMARVTRAGGRIAILELSEPRGGLLGPLARFHVHTVVPRVGAWLSGAPEYQYLQRSIAAFPPEGEFVAMLEQAGIALVRVQSLTFGVCHLYVGDPKNSVMTWPAVSSTSVSPYASKVQRTLDELSLPAHPDSFALAEVSAPALNAERLLGFLAAEDCSYWAEPGGGYEHVGIGWVATLTASGTERFADIAQQAERLFKRLPTGSRLRLFGGFAFQTGRAASPEWQAFGEARFVVPRLVYERTGGSARVLAVLTARELADSAALQLIGEQVTALLELLTVPQAVGASAPMAVTLHERPDAMFTEPVLQIRAAIEAGELEKLVLARRVGVTLSAPAEPERVLRRLQETAPECVRFAFRTGGSTFLGATPERLIEKQEMAFRTEAVAGSIRMGDVSPGRLLESVKDRAEQAIVVRELVRSLEPMSATLDYPAVPAIHRLRHVAHLRTPITGTLRNPSHVLQLVDRLHPTPATGGVPTARALPWIAAHEPDERGWYAGPIGWFDQSGDGAFAVALRSGLLAGRSGALYAGAGIVRGSEAANELLETRWKLAALLGALEVEP